MMLIPGAHPNHVLSFTAAGPPVPIACDSPLLAAEAVAAASAARLPALAASGASELFQSASSQLPMLEASPDSGATYRASLSPAVSAERRRSSFGVAMLAPEVPADVAACEQAVKPSVRASPAGGVAEVASPAADLPAEASAQAEAEVPAASALPSPAVLAPTATDRVSPFAGTGPAGQPAVPAVEPPPAGASAGSTPAQATLLQAETSRVSQGSSTTTGTPSLHIEFSEASLRYSGMRWECVLGRDGRLAGAVPELHAGPAPRSSCSRAMPTLPDLPTLGQQMCPAVDNMPAHSPPRSRHLSQEVLLAVGVEAELPPAAAVTPQQRRVSGVHAASPPAVPANTPASVLRPAVGEQRSLPVPAAAVAQAIEQAAAVQAAEEVKRRASLVAEEAERWASLAAGDAEGRASLVVADAERRASLAAGEAEQQISQQASQQATACSPSASAAPAATPTEPTPEQAASPVPPTPYAATEYDGDDVVMADIGELALQIRHVCCTNRASALSYSCISACLRQPVSFWHDATRPPSPLQTTRLRPPPAGACQLAAAASSSRPWPLPAVAWQPPPLWLPPLLLLRRCPRLRWWRPRPTPSRTCSRR